MCDPGLNPGSGKSKGHYWDGWWDLSVDYMLNNTIISVSNLPILINVLKLNKRMTLFLEINTEVVKCVKGPEVCKLFSNDSGKKSACACVV